MPTEPGNYLYDLAGIDSPGWPMVVVEEDGELVAHPERSDVVVPASDLPGTWIKI